MEEIKREILEQACHGDALLVPKTAGVDLNPPEPKIAAAVVVEEGLLELEEEEDA
jgi:hypothetical protein